MEDDQRGRGPTLGSLVRQGAKEILKTVLPALLLALLVNMYVGEAVAIEDGPSMQPNLYRGDRMITEKISYQLHPPRRGDVVVVDRPGNEVTLVKRVVAVGGGTKSSTWLQIVSDVAGTEQIVPELTIGASYGDAFLAGRVAGILKMEDIEHWVRPGKTIVHDETTHEIYQRFYCDYLELYKNTRDIVHRMG